MSKCFGAVRDTAVLLRFTAKKFITTEGLNVYSSCNISDNRKLCKLQVWVSDKGNSFRGAVMWMGMKFSILNSS